MDNTISYKCPCCGATLVWGSKDQKMICEYCDNKFDEEQLKEILAEEQNDTKEDEAEWDVADENLEENQMGGMKIHICQSCGGEIIGDENSVATECVYCGSPTIITENISGINRPKYIIPFKLDKKAAKEKLKEFYKGKRLLPKLFSNENHIDNIKGIYVPFWLFDCNAEARIIYGATKVKYWSDSSYDYTKTDHYMVKRSGSLGFKRIPADGSSKMDDAYMDSIEPFDYSQMTEFSEKYLSGYYADKYDVDSKENIPRINKRVKNTTEEKFRATVHGYATVNVRDNIVNIKNGKVDYTMFPVWILNTKYKDKMYTFAMNGQTGKFVGELPVDKGKVFKYLFGITAAIFAVFQIFVFLI